MANNDLNSIIRKNATMTVPPLSKECRDKARRVVCGADSCRGAEDARLLLEALDLLEP